MSAFRPAVTCRSRLGLAPKRARYIREKCDGDSNPHATQIEVIAPGAENRCAKTSRMRGRASGAAGMGHFMRQFGPALELPRAKLAAPELTDELIDRAVDGTAEQVEPRSIRQLERYRG